MKSTKHSIYRELFCAGQHFRSDCWFDITDVFWHQVALFVDDIDVLIRGQFK